MDINKKTLVLGASLKMGRYSNLAILSLVQNNYKVVGVGLKEGEVKGVKIYSGKPKHDEIDTITLYMNSKRQKDFYEYIISLNPNRVIFNPGTKNEELELILAENKIFFEHACTLVLLSTGQY
ncbi:MAG: CoA-binding protein [Flavobacteriaceae bacterium]|nr:CoA-binding protein [Flavobacteriaceae bacterium]